MGVSRFRWELILIYVALAAGSLFMFYPFLFQLLASVSSNRDYYETVIVPLPSRIQFQHYIDVFFNRNVMQYFINTLIRALYYIVITCGVSLVASYVFTKLRFKGRDAVFVLFLSSLMLPAQVTLIPTYLIFARFPFVNGNGWNGLGGSGLIDTWGALLLGSAIINVGAIFLVKQTMESVPYDYEEAARVDGAGVFHLIFRIYLPMLKAVMAVIVITTFIAIWNDYLWPLVSVSSVDVQQINTGITSLITSQMRTGSLPNYPFICALSTFVMLPPIIIYLFFQKAFVQGYAMAGIKG